MERRAKELRKKRLENDEWVPATAGEKGAGAGAKRTTLAPRPSSKFVKKPSAATKRTSDMKIKLMAERKAAAEANKRHELLQLREEAARRQKVKEVKLSKQTDMSKKAG